MDAGVLAQVLRDLPPITDPNVLVGPKTADDAGVYKVTPEIALVHTVDFFTPIVDDPATFGSIAAANALSDVYAMGARPLSALAIAAFPEALDPAILGEILAGGARKAREAGIEIIGGHTIKDDEPKYGLAVTGIVDPDTVVRNDTGQARDALILTKALGTGILTTARRNDAIDEAALEEAIASMTQLNRAAGETMVQHGAHAATDISGFGFLGHLREMTGTTLGARIQASEVPLLRGALELAAAGVVPGGTRANLSQALSAGVMFGDSVSAELRLLLCDAQTSGGLLVAIDPTKSAAFLDDLIARGVRAAIVGELTSDRKIEVS